MSHHNESGELGYAKFTIRDKVTAHIKALKLRIRNWDAERWYRKYGGM
ncbi:hypothetical protein [Paenibacillus harenae]|nr:hypothetical protein [Paenibacillus harenae]MDQ0062350.1 hypothetical protein [Paenibacillus harenae]